jgi:DNA-binding NarL/FixJ family response regulator
MTASGQISEVIICDDHYVSALGIEALLRDYSRDCSSPPLQVRTASTGEMALDFFAQQEPDLIMVDLGLPNMSGLEVIKQIRASSSTARVIVLTGLSEPDTLHQVYQLKVNGILKKMNTGQNLNDALNFIKANPGKTYVDSSVDGILRTTADKNITPREYEVLELMTQGLTSDEIAGRMKCAVTTIKTYRARIMNRSGARNSAEMMAWYLKRNGKKDFGSRV